MEGHQYPPPNGTTTREAEGQAYSNGTASAVEAVQRLQQLSEEQMGNIHIDPNLQSHTNHAQQLAQGAIQSLEAPFSGHQTQVGSESPAAPISAAAAAAAAAAARTKTSRACDECRRKKIRCDGSNELEMGSCSACKRSGHPCAYSRTPQKRGPNRGYIRELTQRVELLERERHDHAGSPSGDGAPPLPSQDVAFLHASADLTTGSPIGYVQVGTKRAFEGDQDSNRTGIPPEARQEVAIQNPRLIAGYFSHIHPFLPFLPPYNEDINALLLPTNHVTQNAFTQALELCLISPLYSSHNAPEQGAIARQAYDAFQNCKYDDAPSLLQVHTALLLVVDSINRGASTTLQRVGSNPWMNLKEVMAVAVNNNVFEAGMNASSADETGARRLTLSICILDTFMASANKKHGMVAHSLDFTTLPRPEDQQVFGRRLFELNRITHVIRQVLEIEISDAPDTDQQNSSPFGVQTHTHLTSNDTALLRMFKKAYSENLQAIIYTFNLNQDTLIAMAFWYARILMEVHFYPIAQGSSLLYALRRLIEALSNETSINIFTHHFAGFAAHIVFQLLDFTDTKEEAMPLLDSLSEALVRMVPAHDTESFDAAIKDVVARKRQALRQNSSNLERLATIAVGKSDESAADHGVAEAAAAAAQAALGGNEFSGARLSQEGYITALLGPGV